MINIQRCGTVVVQSVESNQSPIGFFTQVIRLEKTLGVFDRIAVMLAILKHGNETIHRADKHIP